MATLSELALRAQHIRDLYARQETAQGGRPWTRAELAQGMIGDVGDLMKLMMAKDGRRSLADVDARLAHEFGDCLWSLLVLAEAHGIDLETAFHETMNTLEKRLTPPCPATDDTSPRGKSSADR